MAEVVVSGAAGFVGRELCGALLRAGYRVRALTRAPFTLPGADRAGLCVKLVPDLAAAERPAELMAGAEAFVHLAAHVHRLGEDPGSAERAAQRDVAMTERLALGANQAGLTRMVFVSSVKALADYSAAPLARDAPAQPTDPYGRAKLECEQRLSSLSRSLGLQVVVVRPPLVYGPGASANFRAMVRWVRRRVPLPLAGVRNRRSVVSVDNLADFLVRCLGRIEGQFNVFHVSDAEPVSTPQLLGYVAEGLGVRARLFPMPVGLLRALCALTGRPELAARLLGSLELETGDSFAALDWRPKTSTREGILRAVRAAPASSAVRG
ncbi:MAG: NAD-dependent epimerase/dehydratase family protein [Gammaproteobacteria bacterium]|nr:NAD-dependent epimerase/dehydratase family protein [Gammaproteobacteria bacterium]MBV9620799.1 NAD-dependent epimerase/dehydratase family protein [Gammaproteobacteria bacterium]